MSEYAGLNIDCAIKRNLDPYSKFVNFMIVPLILKTSKQKSPFINSN